MGFPTSVFNSPHGKSPGFFGGFPGETLGGPLIGLKCRLSLVTSEHNLDKANRVPMRNPFTACDHCLNRSGEEKKRTPFSHFGVLEMFALFFLEFLSVVKCDFSDFFAIFLL